jgi:octanoyl-[GcvH]:protein N-octanoyltransferase
VKRSGSELARDLQIMRGPLDVDDPAMELAFAHALVRRAGRGEIEPTIRIYRPSAAMAVFGRRDTRLPGFARAVALAREAGFRPAVRATGGRAVGYTPSAVIVDQVAHQPAAMEEQSMRFETFGRRFVDVFRRFGIDARIGAVPGEYCPGAHSVNARGAVKLVGTAQRVLRDAWLFSSLIIVDDREQVRAVLNGIYAALDLPFDSASVGSLASETNVGVSTPEVEQALVAAFAPNARGVPCPVHASTLALAEELLSGHLV